MLRSCHKLGNLANFSYERPCLAAYRYKAIEKISNWLARVRVPIDKFESGFLEKENERLAAKFIAMTGPPLLRILLVFEATIFQKALDQIGGRCGVWKLQQGLTIWLKEATDLLHRQYRIR